MSELALYIVDIASWIALVGGALFTLIGALGIIRFPDFWSRLHAASVLDSGGMILLIVGMMLQSGSWLIAVKLLIIGIFLFITGPTATHAVANAAFVSGSRPKGYELSKEAEDFVHGREQAGEEVAREVHGTSAVRPTGEKP